MSGGLSSGIKNWHWRSKDCRNWATRWFKEELPAVSTSKTKIVEVKEVEGDCDLGMRKSKLVTIYDLKITSVWEGTLEDGIAIRGNIVAIEVSHDMDEDEYVFETFFEDPSIYNSHKEAQILREDAHKALANGLRSRFQKFPKAMIAAHGKDLLADAEAADAAAASAGSSNGGSGTSTPAAHNGITASSSGTQAPSKPVQAASKPAARGVKTAKVKTEGDFMISAADLFELLTSEQKVPSWSRNKATIKPEVGAEVSLFGGNITGKMTSVTAPTKFVQTWRAPTWPDGHFGELTATLEQGSATTKLYIELDGVPVGKEEETETGIETYYIRSLKQIGSVTVSSASTSIPSPSSKTPAHPWNLPGFTAYAGPSGLARLAYLATATASILGSVLLPLSLIGVFVWLLYKGPTFQK